MGKRGSGIGGFPGIAGTGCMIRPALDGFIIPANDSSNSLHLPTNLKIYRKAAKCAKKAQRGMGYREKSGFPLRSFAHFAALR